MFESIRNQYNFVGGGEEADWKRWLLLFLSLTSEVTQYSGFLVSETPGFEFWHIGPICLCELQSTIYRNYNA